MEVFLLVARRGKWIEMSKKRRFLNGQPLSGEVAFLWAKIPSFGPNFSKEFVLPREGHFFYDRIVLSEPFLVDRIYDLTQQ